MILFVCVCAKTVCGSFVTKRFLPGRTVSSCLVTGVGRCTWSTFRPSSELKTTIAGGPVSSIHTRCSLLHKFWLCTSGRWKTRGCGSRRSMTTTTVSVPLCRHYFASIFFFAISSSYRIDLVAVIDPTSPMYFIDIMQEMMSK